MDRSSHRDRVAQLLAEKQGEIARAREAELSELRRASDAEQREVSAIGEALIQLNNFKKDLRGTVRIHLTPLVREEQIRAVSVQIGKWPAWLERPYATYTVAAMVDSDDKSSNGEGRLIYVLIDGKPESIGVNTQAFNATTIDPIIERISNSAAECIANAPDSPYRIPDWYSDAGGAIGALCGVSLWLYLAITWGWWGILLGFIPAVIVGVAGAWVWLPAIIMGAAWLFVR